MTPKALKSYLLTWRENRLEKLAPEVIQEFRRHPERHNALHILAVTEDVYPFQEYASWLSGHLVDVFYKKKHPEKVPEVIDAYLQSKNHSVKRNLLKIINTVNTDYRSGELLERTFEIVSSSEEAIALRSYSFHYLLRILKTYPDLAVEIDAIIEQKSELFASGAMQSCLKHYAKQKNATH